MTNDLEFQEVTVAKVEPYRDGWHIERSDGWHLYVTDAECKQAPMPGEIMRCYGRGIGHTVRGIVIGGRVYRYQTAEQEAEAHRLEQEAKKRERAAKLEAERDERDARIARLPEPLRLRIERFQMMSPEWRAEFEPYELFVCEEAATAFEALKTREMIAAFSRMSYDEQTKSSVPMRLDEHSGNTFGMAMQLAAALADGQSELLPKMHGALCQLVGCEEYGCFAAREAKAN